MHPGSAVKFHPQENQEFFQSTIHRLAYHHAQSPFAHRILSPLQEALPRPVRVVCMLHVVSFRIFELMYCGPQPAEDHCG